MYAGLDVIQIHFNMMITFHVFYSCSWVSQFFLQYINMSHNFINDL